MEKNIPKTVKGFCKKFRACSEGSAWAESTGCVYMRDLWKRKDMRPDWREWVAMKAMTRKERTLYACWCVRQTWHLLKDERSKNAVRAAEKWAGCAASDRELSAARDAAWDAAWDAARDAAGAAAWAAAWAAAGDAAWAAARGRQAAKLARILIWEND